MCPNCPTSYCVKHTPMYVVVDDDGKTAHAITSISSSSSSSSSSASSSTAPQRTYKRHTAETFAMCRNCEQRSKTKADDRSRMAFTDSLSKAISAAFSKGEASEGFKQLYQTLLKCGSVSGLMNSDGFQSFEADHPEWFGGERKQTTRTTTTTTTTTATTISTAGQGDSAENPIAVSSQSQSQSPSI
jgi:hypothetical protein